MHQTDLFIQICNTVALTFDLVPYLKEFLQMAYPVHELGNYVRDFDL